MLVGMALSLSQCDLNDMTYATRWLVAYRRIELGSDLVDGPSLR